MVQLQEFEAELDKKVKQLFESSVPKYYGHTLKVVSNMKELYENSSLDKQLLLAAAYLHDIGYSLPYGDGFVGEIGDQDKKIEIHCREGSGLARKILSELRVEPSVADRVAYLVRVHHRTDIDDVDLKLLIEADKV